MDLAEYWEVLSECWSRADDEGWDICFWDWVGVEGKEFMGMDEVFEGIFMPSLAEGEGREVALEFMSEDFLDGRFNFLVVFGI